ncbi:hypothetical protein MMC07_000032 [Pseudocyphellaria aurata]|nr:hypothetical protein [Pseudocyphellaria aurata]
MKFDKLFRDGVLDAGDQLVIGDWTPRNTALIIGVSRQHHWMTGAQIPSTTEPSGHRVIYRCKGPQALVQEMLAENLAAQHSHRVWSDVRPFRHPSEGSGRLCGLGGQIGRVGGMDRAQPRISSSKMKFDKLFRDNVLDAGDHLVIGDVGPVIHLTPRNTTLICGFLRYNCEDDRTQGLEDFLDPSLDGDSTPVDDNATPVDDDSTPVGDDQGPAEGPGEDLMHYAAIDHQDDRTHRPEDFLDPSLDGDSPPVDDNAFPVDDDSAPVGDDVKLLLHTNTDEPQAAEGPAEGPAEDLMHYVAFDHQDDRTHRPEDFLDPAYAGDDVVGPDQQAAYSLRVVLIYYIYLTYTRYWPHHLKKLVLQTNTDEPQPAEGPVEGPAEDLMHYAAIDHQDDRTHRPEDFLDPSLDGDSSPMDDNATPVDDDSAPGGDDVVGPNQQAA